MTKTRKTRQIERALAVLAALDLPRAQQNERSALCLLALLDLTPTLRWSEAGSPALGITPIMEWARTHYERQYAPNTREIFRRQTMHQFCEASIAVLNPDDPERPVNSPKAVYQIEPTTLALMRTYGSREWRSTLASYQATRGSLIERYARARDLHRVPVVTPVGQELSLTPGPHSELIAAIVESFAPRFAPGSTLVYAGDTGDKAAFVDADLLVALGLRLDMHGKMPDVVLHYREKNWLLLVEAVTSHGPVDGKRHDELQRLFANSSAGLVYVTAFPSRAIMKRYVAEVAWETEVWVADAPDHLIHFNGERFLGPYPVGST